MESPTIRTLPEAWISAERADDLGVVDLRVGPVVLPQRDLLDAEPLQAGVDGLPQVLGLLSVAHSPPSVRTWPPLVASSTWSREAELVEQPRDQLLVRALGVGAELVTGAVGVRGVEQRDAGVDGGPHGVGELLARLGAGLVEGHQAEPDRTHLDASYLVISDLSCLHG